jgi:hypothetical protein
VFLEDILRDTHARRRRYKAARQSVFLRWLAHHLPQLPSTHRMVTLRLRSILSLASVLLSLVAQPTLAFDESQNDNVCVIVLIALIPQLILTRSSRMFNMKARLHAF